MENPFSCLGCAEGFHFLENEFCHPSGGQSSHLLPGRGAESAAEAPAVESVCLSLEPLKLPPPTCGTGPLPSGAKPFKGPFRSGPHPFRGRLSFKGAMLNLLGMLHTLGMTYCIPSPKSPPAQPAVSLVHASGLVGTEERGELRKTTLCLLCSPTLFTEGEPSS